MIATCRSKKNIEVLAAAALRNEEVSAMTANDMAEMRTQNSDGQKTGIQPYEVRNEVTDCYPQMAVR